MGTTKLTQADVSGIQEALVRSYEDSAKYIHYRGMFFHRGIAFNFLSALQSGALELKILLPPGKRPRAQRDRR